jgi:hypothetical protein
MLFHSSESDIPDKFYNEDTKSPFVECVVCQEDLNNKVYFVEKAYKRYPGEKEHQVIFEYAICQECAEKKNGELSEESKSNLLEFMNERLLSRMEEGIEEDAKGTQCLVSGNDLQDCDEYVTYGQFNGHKMLVGMFPYNLSGEVLDQVTELLSEQTLGEIDDFIGEHFSGPPEFRELLKDNKKWVVL